MSQKFIIETDDIRDIFAFNESKELWKLLWNIFDEMAHEFVSEIEKQKIKEPVKENLYDSLDKIFEKYRKRAKCLKYYKDGSLA